MKKSIITLAVLSTLAVTTSVAAYEKGDFLVRVGLTNVSPDADSSNILVGGADFALGGSVVGGVDVDTNTQLGLNFAYFLTDNINVEVLAATPFSHDIEILDGAVTLGSTKHLPPTVTVNYFFMEPSSTFQPYVGAGLNYTIFFDEDFADGAVSTIESAAGATVSDLDLDASFGLSFQVGADLEVADNIFLNASVRYIDIGTEASFKVNGQDLGSVESIDIDPWVYTLSVGYKF